MNDDTHMTALIIDDHPLACMAIRGLLEQENIEVLAEASDGAEGLKLFESFQPSPSMVTIDVAMPIINGIELVEEIRKRGYVGIIIVVSGENDRFYGKRSADAGANAFVSKNEGIKNIIAAINASRNGYSYFPLTVNGFVGSISSEEQLLESLSTQELKVMRYILNGVDNMDIAVAMNISAKTVATYKHRLIEKLKCKSVMELLSFAHRNRIS
ncbi:putative two-component response regulator [Yersinia kristensenii]|uniref:Putative two-component response regulator n=3 Tax=Yersiniaceae TaxID=1903411 RepID=A0A0T9QVW9_9GAMM|nr:putative two-component response regulator [Yersinia thracica]CNK72572.1 putative two-component response regulator [Yersinia aleksiciae]CNK94770.1 putative two-component response regulator [Yersinia kristensenii]